MDRRKRRWSKDMTEAELLEEHKAVLDELRREETRDEGSIRRPRPTAEPRMLEPPMREPSRSAIVGVVLNAFLPGVGYMYMGKWGHGILFVIAVPIAMLVTWGIAWFPWMLMVCIDMLLLKNKEERDHARAYARTMKRCPECAEPVRRDARVCRYCGSRFASP